MIDAKQFHFIWEDKNKMCLLIDDWLMDTILPLYEPGIVVDDYISEELEKFEIGLIVDILQARGFKCMKVVGSSNQIEFNFK